MKSVVISSGHGLYVRGASAIIDEVDEARAVVEGIAEYFEQYGLDVVTFHDNVSKSQDENLQRIVSFHNSKSRELDVSVHFNAYEATSRPMGTETLYVSQDDLASEMSAAIAWAGSFQNRGAKCRSDLYFLNQTEKPSLLLEICFVDSEADVAAYRENFGQICETIALVLAGQDGTAGPPPDSTDAEIYAAGPASWFGGPFDDGVAPDEGLAFISDYETAPYLFLPIQPEGTSGLARRLNPFVPYIACRWDYEEHPKEMLVKTLALVRNPSTGRELLAFPADWGPHIDTNRVADLSPSLLFNLGLQTDGDVEILFPAPRTRWLLGKPHPFKFRM